MLVHYQPIVDLATGGVVRVEAFCRLPDDAPGVETPATFVSHAERHGTIRDLTDFVVSRALRDRLAWRGDLPISINVSMSNVFESDFFERVRDAVTAARVEPSVLTFELSDNIVAIEHGHGLETLHRLAMFGIRISIDGFGSKITERSHIELGRVPVSELKIDAEIVRHITDRDGRAAVERIVALGHDAGLDVVAKSVETVAEYEAAVALGCNLAQGFYYAEPRESDALSAWIEARAAA